MKIRNGFVSNSSSSSFVVAFNPNYNMRGKNKIDSCGDSPFNKIIEMYGQKDGIFDNPDKLIKFWCDNEGVERDELMEMIQNKIAVIESIQESVPKNWKWAEIGQGEGIVSRLAVIILAMQDIDMTGDSDATLDGYDFDNGYMILIYKE